MIKRRVYSSITILVVLVVLLVGCSGTQSQKPTVPSPSPLAPAPYVPDEGTPLAPTTGEPEPATTLQIEVAIEGSAFNPAILPAPPPDPSSLPPNAPAPAPAPNLPVGVIIVWYNNDSVDHTITARNNLFDSGSLSPNDTFKYTFEQSGELEYYCKIHPSKVGKISIE
ncbi:hypothetical protein ACFLX3_00230 [Chloroflexota bacterium]